MDAGGWRQTRTVNREVSRRRQQTRSPRQSTRTRLPSVRVRLRVVAVREYSLVYHDKTTERAARASSLDFAHRLAPWCCIRCGLALPLAPGGRVRANYM